MFFLLTILILLPVSTQAQYDPPEIMVLFDDQDQYGGALPFCNVGDQNDDGYDDLLIMNGNSQLLLFHGGPDMDNEPDFVIDNIRDDDYRATPSCYIGKISDDHSGCFFSLRRNDGEDYVRSEDNEYHLELYYGNEELDDEVDLCFSNLYMNRKICSYGNISTPIDLNDDGYNDFILSENTEEGKFINFYFGGEDLDTIPDWQYETDLSANLSRWMTYSGGCDVNGDGYEDVLVKFGAELHTDSYYLFLGGGDMDHEPVLIYPQYFLGEEYENNELYRYRFNYGYTLMKDMNHDGYDDWAHHWLYQHDDGNFTDGIMIFYGSEEPDLEPDLNLDGHSVWLTNEKDTELATGDFNGDGYPDLVSAQAGANDSNGQINYYFGSRFFGEDVDVAIEPNDEYGYARLGKTMGGVGDYNGDGSDDVVLWFPRIGYNNPTQTAGSLILSGWKNNAVNIEPVPSMYELSLEAYPNPFNSSTTLSLTFDNPSTARLSIHDIEGRLIDMLFSGRLPSGKHWQSWQTDNSGVYFVRLEVDNQQTVRKIVALK